MTDKLPTATDRSSNRAEPSPPNETPFERARRSPEVNEHWDAVDDAARDTDSPEASEAVYEAAIAEPTLTRAALDVVSRHYVAFLEEWYDEAERPIAVLKRTLQRDAENRWALEKLSLLLTLGERWDELLACYDDALNAASDNAHSISLLEEAARIAKDFAGQAQRASDYLKRLLLLRPSDSTLAQALERRLTQQERHQDLVDIWECRIPVVNEEQAMTLRVAIGDRQLVHLSNPSGALASAQKLLEFPRGGSAASELLERIAVSSAPVALRQKALSTLKTHYAGEERIRDVIRTLQQALTLTSNKPEQIEFNRELVAWNTRSSDSIAAQRAAAEWLTLAPESAEALTALQGLAEQTGDSDHLAESIVRAAGAAELPALRAELLLLSAKTQNRAERNPKRAQELYSIVLAESGSEREQKLTAARELLPLLENPEAQAERLEVLEQLAYLEHAPQQRRAALSQGATLSETLNDDTRALRLWTECLSLDEVDLEAHDARVRILSRLGAHEDLLRAYRARFEASADEAQRRADLVSIADLLEGPLERLPRAVETWREVENFFGRNDETVDRLTSLLDRQELWPELVDLLLASAKSETERGRRAAQLTLLADIYRTRLGDEVAATARYAEALELMPAHGGARAGVQALLGAPAAREAAAEALAKSYRTTEQWSDLLSLVETRLECCSGDDDAKQATQQAILLEAAKVAEDQSQLEPALGFVARAFALVPDADTEATLQRLAQQTGQFDAAVAAYSAALARSTDAARNLNLLLAQGRISEINLQQWPDALSSYRSALTTDTSSLDAACSVIRMSGVLSDYRSGSAAVIEAVRAHASLPAAITSSFEASLGDNGLRWVPALDALRAAVNSAELPARVSHDVKFQLAGWYQHATGSVAAAVEILSEAVDEHRDIQSLTHLVDLQRLDPSHPLVQSLLKLSDIAEESLPHLHEAAEVALLHLKNGELAAPILASSLKRAELLLAEDNENPLAAEVATWTVEQWVGLAIEQNQFDEAFSLYTRGAELPLPAAQVNSFRFRAAEIAATRLGRIKQAIELCRKVLEGNPRHSETALLLAQVYEQEGRYEELIGLRTSQLELAASVEERLGIRLQISRVLGVIGGNQPLRLAALQHNLDEQKGHAATIEALTELLATDSQFAPLYDILMAQADALNSAQNASGAATLYSQAGALAHQSLKDEPKALAAYRASVSLVPSTTALDALAEIHTDRGEFTDATTWLTQRLALTPASDAQARETTSVRLARGFLAAGKRPEALHGLEAALAENAAAREARQFLADLREDAGEWQEFAELVAGGVPYLDTADQVRALRRAADVNWRQLHNLTRAVPLLEQANQLEPRDQQLRLNLAEALRSAGSGSRARTFLEDLLEEFGRRRTPERAKAHYELALVDREERRYRESLEHLEAASNILRSDAGILKTLGDVAQQSGELERAERAYRALLLLVTRHQTDVPKDSNSVGESAILFELYRIAESRGETERARDLLDSATQAARQNNEEARRFEAALAAAQRWDLLLDALQQREQRATNETERDEILRHRATALVRLGRATEALSLMLSNVESAGAEANLDLAQQIAESSDLSRSFIEQALPLADSVAAASPVASSRLRLRLGSLLQHEGDTRGAAQQWVIAQELGLQPEEPFLALKAIYSASGERDALIKAYERFVNAPTALVNVHTQLTALYDLAELYLCNTGDTARGTLILTKALGASPNYPRAAAMLHSLAVSSGEQSLPPALATIAERVARHLEDEPLLLTALWNQASAESSSAGASAAETAARLDEAVGLAQRLGDTDKHFTLLSGRVAHARATETLADSVSQVIELAEVEQQRGNVTSAIELFEEAAAHVDDAQRFELELRLASLVKQVDPSRAIELLERLAEETPGDSRVFSPLLELHRGQGNTAELEAVLRRAEQHVTDPREKQTLQIERVRVLISAERVDVAEASLRSLLRDAPNNLQAADLLAELLENAGRDNDVHDWLEEQLSAAISRADEPTIAHYALSLGRRLEADDMDAAVRVYRMANAAARRNRPLLDALLRSLPEGETVERADVLESMIPTQGPDDAEVSALKLAEVRGSLRDEAGVERAYELGFSVNPRSEVLRERLEGWYRDKGHWAPLAEFYVVDAEHAEDTDTSLERFLAAAQLFDEQLGDAASAARIMDRALERLGPSPEILERLSTYWVTAGNPDRPLTVLSDALKSDSFPEETLALLLHLRGAVQARAAEHEPRGIASAVSDLERALSMGRSEVREDLVAVLERQLQLADSLADETLERTTLLRLTRDFDDITGPAKLLNLLGHWVSRHPQDSEVALLRAEHASLAGDHEAAAQAALQLFHSSKGPIRKAAALKYADACTAFGEPRAAHSILEEACREAPEDPELSARLRQLYEASGSFEQLADLLLRETANASPKARHAALLAAAQTLLQMSPPPEKTIDVLEAALALVPEDHATTIGLSAAYTQLGRIEQACAVLESAIKAQGKRRTRELSELQHAMANVAKVAGDDEGRFVWLDAALQSDRRNGEVAAELAIFAMDRDDHETALKALQLITLLKEDCSMSRAEAYLRQAIIALKKDDPKKGVLLARRALATDANYAAAKEFLAEHGQG